jgi:membrane protein
MNWKGIKKNIMVFVEEFSENRIPRKSASLAYYTVFSLPALLLIILWVNRLVYDERLVEGTLFGGLAGLIGTDNAKFIETAIQKVQLSKTNYIAKTLGIITLLLGATGIFGEMQDSINQVWHLKIVKKKGRGWIRLILNKLLSFSMIGVLGFLLLVSLVMNSMMEIFINKLKAIFSDSAVWLVYILNQLATFIVVAGLFAVIFKVLPDARIGWKDVRVGALVSALLFVVGKFVISYIVANNKVPAYYGAAASVLVILIWIYYSSIILFTGAVFTRLYVLKQKRAIIPSQYAVAVENHEVEKEADTDKRLQSEKNE